MGAISMPAKPKGNLPISLPEDYRFPFEVYRMFVEGQVPSLKNNKRVVGKTRHPAGDARHSWGQYVKLGGGPLDPKRARSTIRVLPSERYCLWEQSAKLQMGAMRGEWKAAIRDHGVQPPLFVGLRFARETLGLFDWQGPMESVADAGTKAGLWEDDNVWQFAPIWLPAYKSKRNPGVHIILFSHNPFLLPSAAVEGALRPIHKAEGDRDKAS